MTAFTISASDHDYRRRGASNLTITAKDENGNTVTTYTGSHSLTFSGANAASSGTKPTVTNSSGTATNFGTATAITFTAGSRPSILAKNGAAEALPVRHRQRRRDRGHSGSRPRARSAIAVSAGRRLQIRPRRGLARRRRPAPSTS